MKRIIINGANGYVASNFINELLQLNYEVVALVRGSKNRSAEDRMISALSDINQDQFKKPANLTILDYSLLDKNFGLPAETANEIFSAEVDYYHFAASLKYDFKSRDEIFQTNLDGVENSVRVFSDLASASSRFFFVSTAYSCGTMEGVFEEKFYDNAEIESFRNYYEQSKRFAENMIKKHMDEEGLNAYILRLSQVVGHNKSGLTVTDYGIFDFSKRINKLARRNPDRTLRVKVDPKATQNLIPIDTVVSYLTKTVAKADLPRIFNMVAKQGVKNEDILNSLNSLIPIKLIGDINIDQSEMDAYERIISIGMSFTSSYTDTDLQFDTTNLDALVGDYSNEANAESIHRMLEYFLSAQNGQVKRVYNPAC